jgi:hypothetical protein
MAPRQDNSIDQLLQIIDQAYNRKSWHGTNLRGSLRGISAEQAAWRPAPDRHNIWEIALHAAYWKYTVRRRLLEETRGSFPLKGSNWFMRPVDKSEAAWKEDLGLLDQVHLSMREVVAAFPSDQLYMTPKGKKTSNFGLISGIAAHDLYHAGQIQLLKRFSN